MNSAMNSPAGQESTGTALHPPTAAITAARAAANEAAGKAGLEGPVEAVQTGIVNQKHNRWDRIAVGCCGGFDLRVSTPHDDDSIL